MQIRKQIPNLITLGNLGCGVFAILNIFKGEYEMAVYLVIAAAVLDFFDGFVARLLGVSGELGKQLDSLADMVTFGVVPSMMLYALSEFIEPVYRLAFVLPALFSGYRLAKFNIDTRQTSTFIGVPTPITGFTAVSWAMTDSKVRDMIFEHNGLFVAYCVLTSLLLVSEIPFPSLKIKKEPISKYYQHLFLLAAGLLVLVMEGWMCVPAFYALYVLSSILINFARKKTT